MAAGDVLATWAGRMDWAGEQPASGNVLLQRFDTISGTGPDRTLADAAAPGVTWTARNYSAASASLQQGRWGKHLRYNLNDPATEQTSLLVPHFPGLWPASGKMLFTVWAALTFSMNHSPILSTRNDASRHPLVYLATLNNGNPRVIMYSSTGQALIDRSETPPWTPTPGEWVCYLLLVDLDANTVQLGLVHRDTRRTYVAPVRSFTGEPNRACVADLAGLTLSPRHAFWAGGHVDEIAYSRPAEANMPDLVAQVRNSLWADGADGAHAATLAVSDDTVSALGPTTLHTAAREVTWVSRPRVEAAPALASEPLALTSTDGGQSWSSPTKPADLPAAFSGLLRWHVPMSTGDRLEQIQLIETEPGPVLDPIPPLSITQNSAITRPLTGVWRGTPVFTTTPGPGIEASITGTTLTLYAGWVLGEHSVAVTVRDATGLTSDPQQIRITVAEAPADAPPNPVYAQAPLQFFGDNNEPGELIADPVTAKIVTEVNGEHYLEFTLPVAHPRRHLAEVEKPVRVAGETYRIRRITSYRDGAVPMIEVYAEARFYDLGAAGQVAATEWAGIQPGVAISRILEGTGWTIGRVNVATRRTWSMSEGSPLACLRQVADIHGGDLVFDNTAQTVSLLTQSGKQNGLTFFYGRGARSTKRVEDTRTLVTRIVPRNADGLGIEGVNGGVAWVEDFTWTTEVRTAVYDFAAGTNPHTMLAMATAALGKRSRPAYSYEVDVIDLSAWSGQHLDQFDVGDVVTISDAELGITVTSRIIRLEYDLVRPWNTRITLSEKLRELGSGGGSDAATLATGTDIDTRDLVPFNLLQNSRFDNGLAHWAAAGASVVEGGVTGTKAVELAGAGHRWIEQTIVPDTREVYTVSFQLSTSGFPAGSGPTVEVLAEVIYSDGTSETITQKVT